MPIALSPTRVKNGVTKFTNCRLVRGDELVQEDLWASSHTGKILSSQAAFFDELTIPDKVINLGGRIVSPGLIDVQLNGAFGFNFSTLPDDTALYAKQLGKVNKRLVTTGVTSYVPTLTSQRPELYQKVLPLLARPIGSHFDKEAAESLGAHVEGPFLNPGKNGIHDKDVLQTAETFEDLENCYGAHNLTCRDRMNPCPIKKITVAPEQGRMLELIPQLRARGIVCSIGHSEATYEQASAAVEAGATMITHLFNAMRPLHHRNPGIFGVLGTTGSNPRPFFGIIADGIHLHPNTVNISFNTHPDGLILVTDAMHVMGLPDGAYEWANGDTISNIVKTGSTLLLEGTDTIAGSSLTLIECVNNLLKWSGTSISKALKTVTATAAAMLEIQDAKGCLEPGADADIVVFSEDYASGSVQLVIDEVWKSGTLVYEHDHMDSPISISS